MKSAAALLAAEEKSALEFQAGWDAALRGEPTDSKSLVHGAGRVYGSRERVRRAKEEAEKEKNARTE